MEAVITDKKIAVPSDTGSLIAYYKPDINAAEDYYPFGWAMPGRTWEADRLYRYGFNGKEYDNEVKGKWNQQDYGMRIYDPRVGRFLSVDPLTRQYPMLTPYQYASNRPIDGVDMDGLEWAPIVNWLADKAKAKGNPRLSGFIRSFAAGDINSEVVTLADNIRKGNFKAATQHVLSYTTPGMTVNLGTTVVAAAKGDKEAQGQLLGMAVQAALGEAFYLRKGSIPKVAEEPVATTNEQATRANSGNAVATESKGLIKGTLSDVEARQWYLAKEAEIPNLINKKLPLEEQAKQAVNLRNQFRTEARELMSDRAKAEAFEKTDPNLTWEQIVEKYKNKGFSGDRLWQEIINASQRSRQSVNKSLGLDNKDKNEGNN